MKEKNRSLSYNPQYLSIKDLQIKAKKRIQKFAFEYLKGGYNEEVNLKRNITDLQDVVLMPQYLKKYAGHNISVTQFGHNYVGESSIKPLKNLAEKFDNQIKIMVDSRLRSGPGVASCLAAGADFTFMGRPFMYGVGALEKKGGDHTISILKI